MTNGSSREGFCAGSGWPCSAHDTLALHVEVGVGFQRYEGLVILGFWDVIALILRVSRVITLRSGLARLSRHSGFLWRVLTPAMRG